MAHRPESVQMPSSVAVQLVDLEPVAGLVSAVTRFSVCLTREAIEAMSDDAKDALSDIQAILWRLEHARPEAPREE